MNKAIIKAREGGWNGEIPPFIESHYGEIIPKANIPDIIKYKYLLDPLFWEALGKAEKWEEYEGNDEYPVYRDKWHQFIDHIFEGKSIDSFFEELLDN